MPQATPPRPGDPDAIGGYRILGRLGEGGQGVVFLGEIEGRDPVAIKSLRAVPDALDAARFRREAEVLPRVASFCTAQVITTGTAGGVPYIVSEYIEGPSLQQAVRERGPLRGGALRRLAIGTITALAAIHRAGVVHRDFKPGNVLLGGDGPRVIDFGIARTVDADATGGGPVGTPAYMAPEQLDDDTPGPPADLFAWGATVVFAASGNPPFGADSLAAIVHRILTQDPDLGALDGDLREVVGACLAKDPLARPRAGEVLLRLLGRPTGLPSSERLLAEGSAAAGGDTATPPGPPAPPAQVGPVGPVGPRRRRPAAAGALAALAAVVVTALVLLAGRGLLPGGPGTPAPATPKAAAPVATLLSGSPPAATATVAVPGLNATVHEHPSDVLRLTSVVTGGQGNFGMPAYVRDAGRNTFRRLPDYRDPVVAPGGALVAAIYSLPQYVPENGNDVLFTDRAGGNAFSVRTVDPPLVVKGLTWSRDGTRVLVTVDEGDKSVGFAVVDVAARTSTLTRIDTPGTGTALYMWLPDGSGVVRRSGATGIRSYSLSGSGLHTYPGVVAADNGDQWFSPSGRRMAALCPGKRVAACLLDTGTGAHPARVPLAGGTVLWGWFNEDHLFAYKDGRAVVLDLTGRQVRLLAEIRAAKNERWQVHFTRIA